MNLKSAIKKYLQESKITQIELATKCGIPQSVLSKFLSGKQPSLNSSTIEKLWPKIYGAQIEINENNNEKK